MNFLIDAQLSLALVPCVRERGHEAAHVVDIGMVSASDSAIATRVEADGAILVSNDEDFVTLRLPDRFALRWLRCGNTTNRALAAWLESRWEQIERLLAAGERFVEVR
ncbi:DUF5615 family PIN-like protein [Sphingomonas sp.]|uniref:DUF5615 family PIN-like protein n=1 Tax=Sphingomonas sp. TaxID=28214 RepID=UPI002DD68896|nr:DUF5615 family PIN-like protein [Sphingomonas sp.]